MPASKRPNRSVIIRCSIALVVGLVCLFFGVMIFGHVQIDEFSPYTLERRRSSFYRLPWTNLQITPATIDVTTDSLELYLTTTTPPIIKTKAKPNRWDVVRVLRQHDEGRGEVGDAHLLSFYLDTPFEIYMGFAMPVSGDRKWETWSIDHPKMAKALWPVVIELAREKQYILIPELFEIASNCKRPKQLESQLRTHLAAKILAMVNDKQQTEDAKAAVAVCTTGIRVLGDHRQLLKKRVELYESLGESAAAEKDRRALTLLEKAPASS